MGDLAAKMSATIMNEGVEGVTLHKMRNNEWETIPDLVRLDVVMDKDTNMYFASAQDNSGKIHIRTHITPDVAQQYIVDPNEGMFHTWWIPNEEGKLQAWSLMFQSPEDATRFYAMIQMASSGQTPSQGASEEGDMRSIPELKIQMATMVGELRSSRIAMIDQFKQDINGAKSQIMAPSQSSLKRKALLIS